MQHLFTIKMKSESIDSAVFIFVTGQIINLAGFFAIKNYRTRFYYIFWLEVSTNGGPRAIVKELNGLNAHLFGISNFNLKRMQFCIYSTITEITSEMLWPQSSHFSFSGSLLLDPCTIDQAYLLSPGFGPCLAVSPLTWPLTGSHQSFNSSIWP